MTYERAKLIVDGLVEAGMVNKTAKYEIMVLLINHGATAELKQIESAQKYLKILTKI